MNVMVKHYFEKCVEEAILSSEFWSTLIFNPECPWPLEIITKGVKIHMLTDLDDRSIGVSRGALGNEYDEVIRINGTLIMFSTLCEHIVEKMTED